MVTYTEENLQKEQCKTLEKFREIERVINVATFQDIKQLSCHVLCMAIAELFDLKVVHGYYMRGFEHSWCEDDNGNIYDLYPWGCVGGPILIVRTIAWSLKSHDFYHEDNDLGILWNLQIYEDANKVKRELTSLIKAV